MTEPTAEQVEAALNFIKTSKELSWYKSMQELKSGGLYHEIAQFLADREANNGKDNRWPDPLESDIHKFMAENREFIHVEIMDHLDKLQREIDYSRGGKLGPANNGWNFNMDEAPGDGTRILLWVPPYGPTTGHFDMYGEVKRWNMHSVLNRNAEPVAFKLIELPEVKL